MAPRPRKAATRLVTGDKELDQKLQQLKVGAANKIARPALTKAARHLLKQIKKDVPPDFKSAKKALGFRVDAKGGKLKNEQRAKVGAAVGKAAKAEAKRSGEGKGGVGIGGANIHWFILGASGSSQGGPPRTQKTTKKSTGSMPAQMPGLISNATTQARAEMLDIMRAEATKRLALLAAKNGN